MDPKTWLNAWRMKEGEYIALRMMQRRENIDVSERLNELREELKSYLLKGITSQFRRSATLLKPRGSLF